MKLGSPFVAPFLLAVAACSSAPRAEFMTPDRAILRTRDEHDEQRRRRFVDERITTSDRRRAMILRGEIEVGMTMDQVAAAWGAPPDPGWSLWKVTRIGVLHSGFDLTFEFDGAGTFSLRALRELEPSDLGDMPWRARLLADGRAIAPTMRGDEARRLAFLADEAGVDERSAAILRGEISVGMTAAEVVASWGDAAVAFDRWIALDPQRHFVPYAGVVLVYGRGRGRGFTAPLRLLAIEVDP